MMPAWLQTTLGLVAGLLALVGRGDLWFAVRRWRARVRDARRWGLHR